MLYDCSLQLHFWRQVPDENLLDDPLEVSVLQSIRRLHTAGGPHRLNLPATLRHLEDELAAFAPLEASTQLTARQMVALYHRRLRHEWPTVIASDERLTLTLKFRGQNVACQGVIDRVDQADDGGVTAVLFMLNPSEPPTPIPPTDLHATLTHALLAAAYPHKRPVRLRYMWLYHNQSSLTQLSETQFRQNIDRLRPRVQAWLKGEVLARPGLHCEACPFQYNGCPIYNEEG
jgi:hypothetical protein